MTKVKTIKESTSKEGTRRKVERVRRRELKGPDPLVRIGLMEEYDRINFTLAGDYELVTLDGKPIDSESGDSLNWTVIPDRTNEARAVFSILTTAFAKRDAADKLRRQLSQKNQPARVVEVGEEILIDNRLIADNIKYRVLVGRWTTEREAKRELDDFREDYVPRVVRQIVRPASGTIELLNEDHSSSTLIEDGFRLIPKTDDARVILKAVREGTGFHWEREVDRSYEGLIEIRVDHRGLLMALAEIPLETYLRGVVPAEMPASYPAEALKAQAVAARSVVISYIGMKHPNDPFDLCATVHCQAYSGSTHSYPRTSTAVEETRGQVITFNNQVAEAVFHACCGGHTENKINVWNPPSAPHLEGKWDSDPKEKDFKKLNLRSEIGTEKWSSLSPDVWCNVGSRKELPHILAIAEKYFRWEVNYSRRELEDIIRRKSGEDIGTLLNIIPLERGESGRLMEVEIQGTLKNLRVQRELNIRNILS